MDTFATFLSGQMELPVLDMTCLKGTYDLKLDWITERPTRDAIQDQLGLKFEHRKAATT